MTLLTAVASGKRFKELTSDVWMPAAPMPGRIFREADLLGVYEIEDDSKTAIVSRNMVSTALAEIESEKARALTPGRVSLLDQLCKKLGI